MKNILAVVLVIMSFFFGACAKTKSSNVRTQGIYAEFDITSDSTGNYVIAIARLKVGGPTGTYMDLDGGDKITCNGQELDRKNFLGDITYSRQLPYQVNGNYEFVLSREGEPEKKGAVTLPEAVSIISPQYGEALKAGDAVNISWVRAQNTTDNMGIYFWKKDENNSYSNMVNQDTGAHTIAGSYTNISASEREATLEVSRIRAGSFPDGLTGGYTKATQKKTVRLRVTQ